MSAGKGSKPRPMDYKKFIDNFPKSKRQIEGFVRVKGGKLIKKYTA
jgi:hypothetical protein